MFMVRYYCVIYIKIWFIFAKIHYWFVDGAPIKSTVAAPSSGETSKPVVPAATMPKPSGKILITNINMHFTKCACL